MASIERTAYPRFKQNLTNTELEQLYQPSDEEINFVSCHTKGERQKLTVLILLKSHQHLGYLPSLTEVPKQVVHYLSSQLGSSDILILQETDANKKSFYFLLFDQK